MSASDFGAMVCRQSKQAQRGSDRCRSVALSAAGLSCVCAAGYDRTQLVWSVVQLAAVDVLAFTVRRMLPLLMNGGWHNNTTLTTRLYNATLPFQFNKTTTIDLLLPRSPAPHLWPVASPRAVLSSAVQAYSTHRRYSRTGQLNVYCSDQSRSNG